jgi:hypothetical protein
VTISVFGGYAYGTFENFARLMDTALLPEYKTQIDERRWILRVGFHHFAIAALGIGVTACL